MKEFVELGETIRERWLGANHDEHALPAIAAEELGRADLPARVSAWDVLEWTLEQPVLPKQANLSTSFGQPPVTLYHSSRFHIDVYFWLEGTTAIHQHGFSGAFQVLHGSSLHSAYDFQVAETVNVFMEIGELSLSQVDLFEVGDIQEIRGGRQYIHSLFHLDQPSATIVVRTSVSPLSVPQYSYIKPCLAVDQTYSNPNLARHMQVISTLVRLDHPDADRLINDLLDRSDFQTTYHLLVSLRGLLRTNLIDETFDMSSSQDRFAMLLDRAAARHGALGERFAEIFAHEELRETLALKRQYVTDPEHRFVLALLMNLEGKDPILDLVRQRFPGDAPVDKVLDILFDLANTRVLGGQGGDALGIEEFDEVDLLIVGYLLEDQPDDRLRDLLETELPGADRALDQRGVPERLARLRAAPILRPLLA